MSDEITAEISNPGPTALDSAVSDFIKQTETEYSAEDAQQAASPDVEPAGSTAGSGEPAAKSPDSQPANAAPEGSQPVGAPPQGTDIAKAIVEALAADKAQRKAEKEARKLAEEQAAANREPGNELEALRRMGYDVDVIVRKALAERLGDKAPKELLDAVREHDRDKNYRALEQRVIQQHRELQARTYFDRVSTAAKSFVASGEYSKDAPIVAEVAKRNPDKVHAEVMQEIISDARARMAREPNADPIPYAEAVKRVEKRWAEYRGLFTADPTPQGGEASTKNTPTQAQETRRPSGVVKPPERPLPPWLKRTATEEDGIRLALDEFRRSESHRKP